MKDEGGTMSELIREGLRLYVQKREEGLLRRYGILHTSAPGPSLISDLTLSNIPPTSTPPATPGNLPVP